MRYPIHKKVEKKTEKSKSQRVFELIGKLILALPFLIAFVIFMIFGKIGMGLFVAAIGVVVFSMLCFITKMPETSGYLELGENIIFHNVIGKIQHKKYQYKDIMCLCIDDCPWMFRKNKGKNSRYTAEEWRLMYGKYIIALDEEKFPMFICSYSDTVWKILSERCKDTAEKIFTEKEWLEYKQKQIELEKNAERENGCSEIISKYDGYIN